MNNLIFKRATDLNRELTKEEIQMASKSMKDAAHRMPWGKCK